MSAFNAIGEGGLNAILASRLSVYGAAPAPTVEPAVFAGLTLENDRPEWGHLKGEVPCGVYQSIAAVAATYSQLQLYLPTTARSIAVITRITTVTAQTLLITRLVGISGSLGGWVWRTTNTRDTRRNGNGSSVLLETTTNAAQATNYGRIAVITAIGQTYDQPIVIAPGGAIGLIVNTLNAAMDVNIAWYERNAEVGELV